MERKRVSLKQAIGFHGHLGPYLVLGLLMGDYALKQIKAQPHFGLEVKVWGARDKPKSCLIDGLQLSTGCTFGKGNIAKYNGKNIKVNFRNRGTKKGVSLVLTKDTLRRLNMAIDHPSSEKIAKYFYQTNPKRLFELDHKKEV